MENIRLNLGCGNKHLEGFLNVDKYKPADKVADLEKFPLPWKDSSVSHIIMDHILEHIGHKPKTFLKFMQELYRICKADAIVEIRVPDARHNTFLNDPTHVRAITISTLEMFSKKSNYEWIEQKAPNTTLALHLNIDFEVVVFKQTLDPYWENIFNNSALDDNEKYKIVRSYNNVIIENYFMLHAKKGK